MDMAFFFPADAKALADRDKKFFENQMNNHIENPGISSREASLKKF
jgi:hypothetical protein